MLSLRSTITISAALLVLASGPAVADRTTPTASKATRPQARRGAIRPAAKAVSHRPASPARPASLATASPGATPASAAAPAALPLVYLAGVVLGADGQPCPGVCVFPTTNTHQIAVTDAHGAFQLQVPAHTALSLQAEYVGRGSTRVAVDSETAQPVHITLGR